MARNPTATGLLLIGHGTGHGGGLAEHARTVAEVARLVAPVPVANGFLECAAPSVPAAAARLIDQAVERLVAVPALLFAAGHARRDVPRILDQIGAEHPRLNVVQAAPLGTHAGVLALSASRFRQAVAGRPPLPAGHTQLVLVGRGSRDDEAVREMFRFAQLRRRQLDGVRVETCFCAMAEPSLESVLARVSTLPAGRIVVQPHLLFQGQLTETVRRHVQAWARADDRHDWVIARHLGPAAALARALVDRFAEVAA